ncbi:MAG: aldehyde ferredoxin oxidoreductase C-terminal domain-containing protein [Spirochaetota bacterium]
MGTHSEGIDINQVHITVDMTDRTIEETPVPAGYEYLSGRGLISKTLLDEVDPTCHPLSPANPLIFAPGMFAGTYLSSCNRLSAGAKSPLTGGIKESNSGGVAAFMLGKLGIRALKLTGASGDTDKLAGLRISKEGVSFEDLTELKGKGTYETTALLRKRFGEKTCIISIGSAGEMLMAAACIGVTDMEGEPCRNLGRGGLGAVMGSKGLKAIIIDDTGTEPLSKHSGEAKTIIKEFAKMLREHPVTGEMFPKFGTAMTLLNVNGLGGLPTRNFTSGRYEKAEEIGGPRLYEIITERGGMPAHACMPGCVIRCSNKYSDKAGRHMVGSIDFETICLMGSNLDLSDYDQIAELNLRCNDIGIDTIETGVALGVLCEAGALRFGDFEGILSAVEAVGKGEPLGRLLGAGAAACGKAYGLTRVPVVKNQGMAAYDPRVVKGMGVTYAMSPMGADHTAGNAITLEAEHTDPEGKVPLVRGLHVNTVVYDSLGVCIFTGRVMNSNPHFLERMLKALWGWEITIEELRHMAEEALNRELEFNRRAGFTSAHDRLPGFMYTEKLPPSGMTYDIPVDETEKVYDF